jgi:VanZ family protein
VTHYRAKAFFCLYLCAVTYLSLYPWEFTLHAKTSGLIWAPLTGRRQILDAVLNVLFYVPLGASAYLSIRRGWIGWWIAIGTGTCVSWTIEWLQLWSVTRFGNQTDLLSNVIGTVGGATVGYLAVRGNWFPDGLHASSVVSRWQLHSRGALFLAAWSMWHLSPFIPAISLARLLGIFSLMNPWSWQTLAETFLGFAALRFAVGRSPWLWVAFAAVPAQAFLLERSLSLSSVCGAGLGWAAAGLTGAAGLRWLGVILPVWLTFEELRPFSLGPLQNHIAWAPFGSWYSVSSGNYYPVIFGKLFLYLSVIWGLRERRARWWWAIGIPAAILAGGEWMQQYLPGRTPESTDVVLLLAAATLLALCAKGPDTRAQS